MKKYGRYEVRKKLGGGGMGVVFLAYDPRLGREVAIKVIGAFVSDKDQSRQRFKREAEVMADLNHAAIVPIYDFGEQDGQPYLVMRLMLGGSLGDLLDKKGRFSLAQATQLFERLAPALDMAHARGMVHRDLKPDNILLDQFDHPAITDFGLVKWFNASTLTKSSRMIGMGTPPYMSPEQGRGKSDIDHRTDIYALGVILFQLLTGQWPYESDNIFGFVYLHNTEPIPNICDLNPDLPPECQTVIECVLAKEREERYDSVHEFVEALKALQVPKRPAPVAPQPQVSAVEYLKRGHEAYQQKNYELATVEYSEALRLRPTYTNAYMSRGNAYYWSGEYGLAITDYNQALQVTPNYVAAYYWRGRAKQEQGKRQEAIQDYEEVLRINPKYAGAYYQRGLVRQEMGQLELALADYEAALRVHPKHMKAKQAQQAVAQQIKDAQEREEARKREEERKREEAEARKREAERKRKEAEARQREEERKRKEAEAHQREEERKRKEAEARQREEERKRKEAERQRELEEARQQAEARKREEERKYKLEESRKRQAKRKRKRKLDEAHKREEERRRKLDEAHKREAERKHKQEEARKLAESRKREEEERKRKLEEAERKRKEEEARKQVEARIKEREARIKQIEGEIIKEREARVKKEEARKLAEAHKREQEEARNREAERKRKQEEARQREAERKRKEPEIPKRGFFSNLAYLFKQEGVDKLEEPGKLEQAEARKLAEARRREAERQRKEKDPWIGRIVDDRYMLKQYLGKGRSGAVVVYASEDIRLGREVALKLLLWLPTVTTEMMRRFINEARLMAGWSHPNVVSIHDVGKDVDVGVYYIVMQRLSDTTLRDQLVDQGRLSQSDAIQIAISLAQGLNYAHERSVVHCGIEPTNVLFNDGGRPMLAGFGMAKALDVPDKGLTLTGTMIGEPSYMSPEQMSGEILDHRSDIYSLGILLYHMLTGRPPFQGNGRMVRHVHLFQAPVPPRRFRPDLNPELEKVILKALAKKPHERFQSANEMAQALNAILQGWSR